MRPARILCTRWLEYTNIGNGFICEAEARLIRSIAPSATIIRLPINDLWLSNQMGAGDGKKFELWSRYEPDLITFSTTANLDTVDEVVNSGHDVLFNGFGLGKEVQIDCSGYVYVLTRGQRTFYCIAPGDNIRLGIDVAWFLMDYILDVELSKDYDIVCLDDISHLDTDDGIDRSNYAFSSHSSYIPFMHEHHFKHPTFVSDKWEDYISLYAKARRVLTDRVHCALVCLVLGKEVKFVGDTFRDEVFYAAGIDMYRFKNEYIKLEVENKQQLREAKASHALRLSGAIYSWARNKGLEV
jgi:hypothetical protein